MTEEDKVKIAKNLIKEFELIQLNDYSLRKSFKVFPQERDFILDIINMIKMYNIDTLDITYEDIDDIIFGKSTIITYRNIPPIKEITVDFYMDF